MGASGASGASGTDGLAPPPRRNFRRSQWSFYPSALGLLVTAVCQRRAHLPIHHSLRGAGCGGWSRQPGGTPSVRKKGISGEKRFGSVGWGFRAFGVCLETSRVQS